MLTGTRAFRNQRGRFSQKRGDRGVKSLESPLGWGRLRIAQLPVGVEESGKQGRILPRLVNLEEEAVHAGFELQVNRSLVRHVGRGPRLAVVDSLAVQPDLDRMRGADEQTRAQRGRCRHLRGDEANRLAGAFVRRQRYPAGRADNGPMPFNLLGLEWIGLIDLGSVALPERPGDGYVGQKWIGHDVSDQVAE